MDPLGFAFENFNSMGAWREKDGEFAIDATGVLPDGKTFDGPDQLKQILREKKELFIKCIVEKMLTYALGRGLEYYDKCTVDKIIAAIETKDNRFSSLLSEIIMSDPFQMRTSLPLAGNNP